jgi:hypothetical protein
MSAARYRAARQLLAPGASDPRLGPTSTFAMEASAGAAPDAVLRRLRGAVNGGDAAELKRLLVEIVRWITPVREAPGRYAVRIAWKNGIDCEPPVRCEPTGPANLRERGHEM